MLIQNINMKLFACAEQKNKAEHLDCQYYNSSSTGNAISNWKDETV